MNRTSNTRQSQLLYLWHSRTVCHSVVISVAQQNSMSQCCYICGTAQQYVTVLLYLWHSTTVLLYLWHSTTVLLYLWHSTSVVISVAQHNSVVISVAQQNSVVISVAHRVDIRDVNYLCILLRL
jgi:hypothetical protein